MKKALLLYLGLPILIIAALTPVIDVLWIRIAISAVLVTIVELILDMRPKRDKGKIK